LKRMTPKKKLAAEPMLMILQLIFLGTESDPDMYGFIGLWSEMPSYRFKAFKQFVILGHKRIHSPKDVRNTRHSVCTVVEARCQGEGQVEHMQR
jgi:hypothetical protein